MFSDVTDQERLDYIDSSDCFQDLFRAYRNDFIQQRLQCILNEHHGQQSDYFDSILRHKADIENEKVCISCGAENERSLRKCSNRKGPLLKENTNKADFYNQSTKQYPYKHFTNVEINQNKFTVKTGEPDLVNPSGFENISSILFNIAERAQIRQDKESRQWMF